MSEGSEVAKVKNEQIAALKERVRKLENALLPFAERALLRSRVSEVDYTWSEWKRDCLGLFIAPQKDVVAARVLGHAYLAAMDEEGATLFSREFGWDD